MKKRLISAMALLFALSTIVILDCVCNTAWFSTIFIVCILVWGIFELIFLILAWNAFGHTKLKWHTCLIYVVLAIVCIAVPGICLLLLRWQANGIWIVLYVLAVPNMTDNGALFIGRFFGKHKLVPKISPAKTLEGVVGGLAAGVATSLLLGPVCLDRGFVFSLFAGLLLGSLAVFGDFAESAIKRAARVKDSGTLMPGVGGVLDLIDSILPCTLVVYLIINT